MVAAGTGGVAVRFDLCHAYVVRVEGNAWHERRPDHWQLEVRPNWEFAAIFELHRRGNISPHCCHSRVAFFRSFLWCKPRGGEGRGDTRADYYHNSLLKFRPWLGGLHNGRSGPTASLPTRDRARRQHMADNRESKACFATNSQGYGRRATCRLHGGTAAKKGVMATATQLQPR